MTRRPGIRPRVLLVLAPGTDPPPEVSRLHDVAHVVCVDDAPGYLAERERADAMLVWDIATPLVRDYGPGPITWIHTNSIGVNTVATSEVADAGVLVTNTRGVFEEAIAEFVLAGILSHIKRLRRTIDRQRQADWSPASSGMLRGRRTVIVGAGGIGRSTAALLRVVGVEVLLVGRTRRGHGVDLVHGVDELPALLGQADDLVLAVPLTDATHGMIGAHELAALRPGAHLVNVGRGALVDECALVEALAAGRLGGATLDVFAVEPLPKEHPFWGREDVLVSPHQSANFDGWRDQAMRVFIRNLGRRRRGEPLENVVELAAVRSDLGQSERPKSHSGPQMSV